MKLDPAISNELRTMVREVLHDTIRQRPIALQGAAEPVRIANDADLQAFVMRLMDPALQDKVKSGQLRFTLASAIAAPPASGTALTGVITEKAIDRIASNGTLTLGAGAVLTPLARDRARRLGLRIERRP